VVKAARNLRFGFITFHDHLPHDTYVIRVYPPDSDVGAVKSNLAKLVPDGSGDGPQALCDALAGALFVGWNDIAVKMAILFTDSPPHGIGEDGDKFPDRSSLRRL